MICTYFRLLKGPARTLVALLAFGSLAGVANAINMPYVLDNSTATLSDVNPQSDFYKVDFPNSESGAGSKIFDYIVGVDAKLGEFVQLTWAGNPKPFLTGVGLKAGGAGSGGKKGKKGGKGGKKENGSVAGGLFAMVWDVNDLSAFNTDSRYDAVRIYQDGIIHKNDDSNYLGISHITVSGEPGEAHVNVPDSGSAFAMLGVGIGILFVLRRTMKGAN